jgi:hypothetical protein
MKDSQTVNIAQAAKIAGVSDSSISAWILAGAISGVTYDGQSPIIPRATLHEVLAFRASNGARWMQRLLKRPKPVAGSAAEHLPFATPATAAVVEHDGLHEDCGPDFMWCARVHGCEAMRENRAEAIRDVLDDAGVVGQTQVSVWLIDEDGDPAGAASKFWVRVWREVRFEVVDAPAMTDAGDGGPSDTPPPTT